MNCLIWGPPCQKGKSLWSFIYLFALLAGRSAIMTLMNAVYLMLTHFMNEHMIFYIKLISNTIKRWPKVKKGNFRGIVYFLFLISIKLSLKWALVETSTTKLMFLYLIAFFRFSGNSDGPRNSWELSFCPIFKMLVSKCSYGVRLIYIKYQLLCS